MLQNLSRRALAFGIAVMGLPGLTAATEPASTGLGQAWPNTTDVSVTSHYHAYVFKRDGIRYVQINDANGVVRGAIAIAGDEVLVLPIGVDAARVKTLHAATSNAMRPNTTEAETVYRDSMTTLSVTPLSTGALQITTQQAATCTNPAECSVGSPSP
ncbi:hypothetical protein BTI_2247 [Burkholderia thailandensis MSMB121]|uniref:hypothetical protein n=1 Tax=Burkholderia humptydooensis TaxID=430531 RepID=UPI000327FEA2|nr:hypothetical protein [Burkholderia humptydooensis]AGK46970.1 hypothetical protein BTI_2247 [Burkholderia thailandensis MSMB121]ATF37245.1 hypothetical protein CO709_31150 [Burkholderia thailandensis]KST74619.1 hypothetical protein WS76_10920 [Burkholderia humptydooensis]